MTNRRKPAQRTISTEWKPGLPRAELAKAIGGAAAVVLGTALLIFLLRPGDSGSSVPTPSPAVTIPTGSTPPSSPGATTGSTGSPGATGSTGDTGTPSPAPAPTPPSSTP